MCVHHTKNYRRGLLRLEFEACGGVSGWIGKSGSDEGGNRPDQEGQQKHLSKEKLDCMLACLIIGYIYNLWSRPTMLLTSIYLVDNKSLFI